MNRKSIVIGLALCCLILLGGARVEAGKPPSWGPTPTLLVSGLAGGSGSAIGPGGSLYVTEGATGRVLRVDPQTGQVTTFASGLPQMNPAIGIGGAIDVAFIGATAYVLVTLVSPDVGGSAVDGIYRVDGPNSFSIVADLGQFNMSNPPTIPFPFFVPTGVLYTLQTYRGGFLVTDGHLNRVLQVTTSGGVSVFNAFGDVVPTGLAVSGNTVYMAEAGPVPHLPQNGKVVSFGPNSLTATEAASGAPLLVDVEFGRGRRLYALSQGQGSSGPPGSPALPNTGALVEVDGNGSFTLVTGGLDRPTSLEFIGNTAYVVTLTGQIWKIADVSGPPFGASH